MDIDQEDNQTMQKDVCIKMSSVLLRHEEDAVLAKRNIEKKQNFINQVIKYLEHQTANVRSSEFAGDDNNYSIKIKELYFKIFHPKLIICVDIECLKVAQVMHFGAITTFNEVDKTGCLKSCAISNETYLINSIKIDFNNFKSFGKRSPMFASEINKQLSNSTLLCIIKMNDLSMPFTQKCDLNIKLCYENCENARMEFMNVGSINLQCVYSKMNDKLFSDAQPDRQILTALCAEQQILFKFQVSSSKINLGLNLISFLQQELKYDRILELSNTDLICFDKSSVLKFSRLKYLFIESKETVFLLFMCENLLQREFFISTLTNFYGNNISIKDG